MEYYVQLQKLCQIEMRSYIFIMGIIAVTYLMFQSSMLPYGNAIKSLLPDNEVKLDIKDKILSKELVVKPEGESDVDSSSNDSDSLNKNDNNLDEVKGGKEPVGFNIVLAPKVVAEKASPFQFGNGGRIEQIVESDHQISRNSSLELNGSTSLKENENVQSWKQANIELPENVKELPKLNESSTSKENDTVVRWNQAIEFPDSVKEHSELNGISNVKENDNVMSWNQGNSELLENVKELPQKDFAILGNDTEVLSNRRRKKVRPGMPPISVIQINEMNRRLARHLASSSKIKPQWSTLRNCEKEIVDAKFKIIDAPTFLADKDLYAPVFRNVSKFIRSYELMEKTLKVYVYKDGKKPIFHQPILKGLYASEGWFMKLMEGNKHFVVKDPEKAHLFYMPFSSRMLEYALYVPDSHNRTKLRQFVKGYTNTISAKYPFWNRTGGTDHFVAACHDWALYETRHHMENTIKALCNADVTIGFKIGRDVSLPETFVRYARNPLRDLGGKPPSKRSILAFYAGNSHGYLRPILLKYWKNKDPDMRIHDLLPASVSKKMNYMQHMKSSKYCICPKGFEVNSPRVVEAIFYECVPVIISDNFVPPLFEVLNWEAFSIIIPEKDIPNLKNILLSIPEAKYLEMQLAVRKVQQHFLWHARPVKYDLFYMTLHSIWHSRVFQIRKQ